MVAPSLTFAGSRFGLPAAPEAPDDNLTDEELLERIRDRDLDALGALHDRYSGQVFGLAQRMLRNRESAEEVTQDAFMSVWRQAQTYRPSVGKVRPWLLSIVHHRAIDRIRRVGERRQNVPLDEAWMRAAPADTFDEALRAVQHEEVRRWMARLPADQRRAIDLAYFDGNTFVEIAEMTGVPVGTVKSRVRLGLAKLRGMMASWREAPQPA